MTKLQASHPASTRLHHQVELILQTRNAQDFFLGRLKNCCGLLQFNKLVREIQIAASHDDPYADWVLLRIYDAVIQAERKLNKLEETIHKDLKQTDGIEFKLGTANQPLKVPIRFATLYARKVASLIVIYDHIVRYFLAARYMGLDNSKAPSLNIENASKILREVLAKAQEWHKTGVTREDVRQKTALAQETTKVFEQLGELPLPILTGELRAPNAPAILN